MIGDLHDLMVMTQAVQAITKHTHPSPDSDAEGDDAEVYTFSARRRRRFVRCVGVLLRTFSAAEIAHRQQFGISGQKNPVPVSCSGQFRDVFVG
jgi:hypothetical protein